MEFVDPEKLYKHTVTKDRLNDSYTVFKQFSLDAIKRLSKYTSITNLFIELDSNYIFPLIDTYGLDYDKIAEKIYADIQKEKVDLHIPENKTLPLKCAMYIYNLEENRVDDFIKIFNKLKEIYPNKIYFYAENCTNAFMVPDYILGVRQNISEEDYIDLLLKIEKEIGQDIYITEEDATPRLYEDNNVTIQDSLKLFETIDKDIEKINSYGFTPFEKFLYIHDLMTKRAYQKAPYDLLEASKRIAEKKDIDESRSIYGVLNSDYIVCAGYANLMKAYCRKAGIDCGTIVGYFRIDEPGHSANIVNLKDSKYRIDGQYFCDACYDAPNGVNKTTSHYAFSALPMQDFPLTMQFKHFQKIADSPKSEIKTHSKIIPISSYVRALESIHRKVYGKEPSVDEKVEICKKLFYSCNLMQNAYKIEGENAFSDPFSCTSIQNVYGVRFKEPDASK